MKLDIHRTDNGATVTIRMGSNGSGSHAFIAELEAKPEHQYAVIDGLLWSLLQSELHAFLADGSEHAPEATAIGNRLATFMRRGDFHNGTQEDAQRITRTIAKHIPELAPLAHDSAYLLAWHAHIQHLANVLKMRMVNVGDTWHGIHSFLKAEEQAA